MKGPTLQTKFGNLSCRSGDCWKLEGDGWPREDSLLRVAGRVKIPLEMQRKSLVAQTKIRQVEALPSEAWKRA